NFWNWILLLNKEKPDVSMLIPNTNIIMNTAAMSTNTIMNTVTAVSMNTIMNTAATIMNTTMNTVTAVSMNIIMNTAATIMSITMNTVTAVMSTNTSMIILRLPQSGKAAAL